MPKDKKNCAPVDPKDKLFWAVFFETLQACISCVGRLQTFDNSIFLVPHGESVSRSLCVASGDGSIIRVKGMEDVLSPDLDVFGTRMEECAMKVAGGLKKDSGIHIAARVRTCHGFRDLSDFIKYHAPALEEMSTNLNKLSGLCDTVEDMDVPKEYLDAALYINSEAAALVAPPSRSVQFLKQFDDSSRPKKSSKQDPGQEDSKSHLVKRSKAERNDRGCDAEYCPDAPVKKKIQQKKTKTTGIEVAR